MFSGVDAKGWIMAKKEPASTFDVFQDIEFIFGVLPSLDLRNELVASFNKVIGFLGEMLGALEKIPTRDEMIERGIPEAIDCLKRFFQNLQKIAGLFADVEKNIKYGQVTNKSRELLFVLWM